ASRKPLTGITIFLPGSLRVANQPEGCEIDPSRGELPPAVVLRLLSRGLLFRRTRDRWHPKGLLSWYGMAIQHDRSRERPCAGSSPESSATPEQSPMLPRQCRESEPDLKKSIIQPFGGCTSFLPFASARQCDLTRSRLRNGSGGGCRRQSPPLAARGRTTENAQAVTRRAAPERGCHPQASRAIGLPGEETARHPAGQRA